MHRQPKQKQSDGYSQEKSSGCVHEFIGTAIRGKIILWTAVHQINICLGFVYSSITMLPAFSKSNVSVVALPSCESCFNLLGMTYT